MCVPKLCLGLCVQQSLHHVQRVLQRLGVTRGAGRVRRVEGRHTEHNLIRMRIVRTAIALWRDRAVAHEAVRRAGNLNMHANTDIWYQHKRLNNINVQ